MHKISNGSLSKKNSLILTVFCFGLFYFPSSALALEVYSKNGWANLIFPISDSFVFTQIPSSWQKKLPLISILKKGKCIYLDFFQKAKP